MIELNFPDTGWLRLDRDVLRDLARYQAEHGLTTLGRDRPSPCSRTATAPGARRPR